MGRRGKTRLVEGGEDVSRGRGRGWAKMSNRSYSRGGDRDGEAGERVRLSVTAKGREESSLRGEGWSKEMGMEGRKDGSE